MKTKKDKFEDGEKANAGNVFKDSREDWADKKLFVSFGEVEDAGNQNERIRVEKESQSGRESQETAARKKGEKRGTKTETQAGKDKSRRTRGEAERNGTEGHAQSNMINLTKLFGLVKKSKQNEKKCLGKTPPKAKPKKKFLIKARTEQVSLKSAQKTNNWGRRKLRTKPLEQSHERRNPANKTSFLEHAREEPTTKLERRFKKSLTHQLRQPKKVSEAPVAYFRSGDNHVKRFLRAKQVEVRTEGPRPGRLGLCEELKWVAQDSRSDFRRLRKTQLFNHFENIDELTRKTSLSRNLGDGRCPFYPDTFNLSTKQDRRSFKEEFFLRVSFKLLKNHVRYFLQKKPDLVPRVRDFLARKWKRHFDARCEELPRKDKLYFECFLSKFVNLTSDVRAEDFVVNTMLLRQMLYLWQSLARRLTGLEDQFRFFSPLKFDQDTWARFQLYADLPLNYESLSAHQRESIGLAEEYWTTPSLSLLVILLDLDALFSLQLPEYRESSDHNLWVVKPSCNSKGTGIFVSKDIADIRRAWKNNVNRLVQKYVENCLTLGGRKFDLRVWVLLESVAPLRVWVFDRFYLRFCPDEFDLARLDSSRHLTNFSLNKDRFRGDWAKSVMQKRVLVAQLQK